MDRSRSTLFHSRDKLPILWLLYLFLESIHVITCFYGLQQSCGQGYVFTHVCDSVHGGVCLKETPLQRRHPLPRRPPAKETPPPRRPPRKETPLPRRPPWEGGTPLLRKEAPPRHTVNERPVRILLECILVF